MSEGEGEGDGAKQLCPYRNDPGPWPRRGGMDAWVRERRWTADPEAAQAQRDEFMEKHPDGGISEVAGEWVWEEPVPRTCTFCGGVHPEDAVRLVEELGWWCDGTDRPDKKLLVPGDVARCRRELWQAVRERREAGEGRVPVHEVRREEGIDRPPSPVPPVKLRTRHMTKEQAERFNAALRARWTDEQEEEGET